MTSQERVIAALNHQVTDRVPVDMGGTIMSGIAATSLDRLRRHLRLEERPVKVYEVFQMLGEVEMDVAESMGVDVLPVEPPSIFFGLRRENWKPWTLFDGTEVLMPGKFDVEVTAEGDWLLHHEGDPAQPVEAKMPKDGFYFDMPSMSEWDPNYEPPPLEELLAAIERPSDADIDFMAARARTLRENTDKALVLGDWRLAGVHAIGSIPTFLCLIGERPEYVREWIRRTADIAIEDMERVWHAIGEDVDILGLDGLDYGSQRSEMLSPALFKEIFIPSYRKQLDWIHKHTTWKAWKHTCGCITKILPMLVQSGLDIIAPVQCTAEGMDPAWLKQSFGDKVTFWGGGVNTQSTMAFGSVDDVRREAAERIDIFGKDGGFMFCADHNIQPNTSPERVMALRDAVESAT